VEQRPVIRRLELEYADQIYAELTRYAPEYLRRCGFANSQHFRLWASSEGVWVVEQPEGLVLLSDWKLHLSVRIHAVVWGRKIITHPGKLSGLLQDIKRMCMVERIEALVPVNATRGIDRLCKRAGFCFEGILRKSVRYNGATVDGLMWALVEDTDGC